MAKVVISMPDDLLKRVDRMASRRSANRSGLPAALTPLDAAWLGGLAAVLDGGRARAGVPSTLLDLSGPHPILLREGPIGAAKLLTG